MMVAIMAKFDLSISTLETDESNQCFAAVTVLEDYDFYAASFI